MNEIDNNTKKRIDHWLSSEYDDDTIAQVKQLVEHDQKTELIDSFYKELEFGTGGLRGIMGVGSNRINRYTIGKATQGLANYLKKKYPNESIKVAIAYDSRHNSQTFGQLVADIFSANDIQVYLFDELRPTPLLSFAIRHFGCHSGVMLTASHNPKIYNGYKAYWKDGCQLVAPQDTDVIEEVNAIQSVKEIKFEGKQENIIVLKEDFDKIYISANYALSISPDIVLRQKDLKIVFSPIHGTGITLVPKTLEAWGFSNVTVVDEQATPDGSFPTVIYPNPEEEDAMALAQQKGKEIDADLVMATDPDADRVGIAVKNNQGDFQLLNGNQIGSLLVYYVLSAKKDKNDINPNDYIVKTIVTTSLIADIADSFGVKHYDTLTGFKYIGHLMTSLLGQENYLVGGEESYGYLVGDLVRDKDAVNACAFIAEMAAYFKAKDQSIYDVLLSLYQQYGCYQEKLISLTKEGKAGAEEIKQIMVRLRKASPSTLGGTTVQEVRDYLSGISLNLQTGKEEKIDLPQSDVLQFITTEGDVISARPSGTEPKIKFYCSVKAPLADAASYDALSVELAEKLERIMTDLVN